MEEKKKRLIIIDSNALIHRAYHALPTLTTKKGELVNAIYGFLLAFLKAIKDFQPDYIAATFDAPGPTLRHKEYKEYKAKRPKAPEELYQQIPKVKEILEMFGVQTFEKSGYEADDLIAAISEQAPRKQVYPEIETYILTGDLDTLQLVNKNTKVYTFNRGIKEAVIYDKEKVMKRFGILPKQIVDFKALAGDPSDNIPGASGIGKKTATELLQRFGSVEKIYQAIEKGEDDIKPRIKDILIKNKDQVLLSQQLAKARKDVPIDFNLERCRWQGFNKEKAGEVLRNYEFYSLLKRLNNDNKEEKVQNSLL